MQKRCLGNTNIKVSALGLGTVKFGRNEGVKYPHAFNLPTDKEIQCLLSLAFDLGINLLDTAPAYGTSEEKIGKLLPGNRHDWVICTKVGEVFDAGRSQFDFSKEAIQHSIERSLRRLKTDYLDNVLIHSHGEDETLILENNILDLLATLKREGKIRSFGMSTKTLKGGLLAAALSDVVMMTYRPDYQDEREILDYAYQNEKGILIKKALASGHVNKIPGVNPVKQNLDFIFSHPGVSSVVIGTINPTHLQQNASLIE